MEWIVEAETLSDLIDHGRYSITSQPLIRCKDCKYSDENWRRVSGKWLPCMEDIYLGDNWYCGSAERREE